MTGKGSKTKGSNFEREVCKILSGMWDPKLDLSKAKAKDLPFSRTPYSGADKRFPLDIIVPDDFPWMIEAKKREEVLTIERLLMGDSPLMSWLRKAEADLTLSKSKKPVMVIAARNHVKPIIACRAPDILIPDEAKHLYFTIGDGTDLLVMPLDDFVALGKDFWTDCI